MICPRCGENPTPQMVEGNWVIIPCGLIDAPTFSNLRASDCPMSDWQEGYADALRDEKKKEIK
jgi:hypothetical protein